MNEDIIVDWDNGNSNAFKARDLRHFNSNENVAIQQLQFFYQKDLDNVNDDQNSYVKAFILHHLLDYFRETRVNINDIDLVFEKFLQNKVTIEITDSKGIKIDFQREIGEIFNLLKDNKNESKQATTRTNYKVFSNIEPTEEYWKELFRITKNQIIWGVNFYTKINLAGGRLIWDKKGTAFGRAEMAYLSMTKSVNICEIIWNGMIQHDMKNKEVRIHPTQNRVRLYEWLLDNYAKE